MTHRLYASSSKIIAADADLAAEVRAQIDDIDVFTVTETEPGIELADKDGATLPMVAPTCGATVLVGDPGDIVLDPVVALWTRADLSAPPIVNRAEVASGSVVVRQIAAELEAELLRTASSAVELDRQIALLREEVEDGRATISDLRRQLRTLGQLPAECFVRRANGTTTELSEAGVIRQPLPFTGHRISAIGITFDPDTIAGLDTCPAEVALIAREDGEVLGQWLIHSADVAAGSGGEALLALARPIDRRYRFLDLDISLAASTEQPPRIRLASDGGDTRMSLVSERHSLAGQMLALRLWAGPLLVQTDRNDGALFTLGADELAEQKLRVPIPKGQFAAIRKLTPVSEDLNWFRQSGNDLFCHPPGTGPNILAIPLEVGTPVEGLSTRLELANDQAYPTEFGVICSPLDLSADQVADLLSNKARSASEVLAAQHWVELRAGTARAVELTFPRPVDRTMIYLATRVTGGRNDYAHAWFREVMALRAGVLRAAA